MDLFAIILQEKGTAKEIINFKLFYIFSIQMPDIQ